MKRVSSLHIIGLSLFLASTAFAAKPANTTSSSSGGKPSVLGLVIPESETSIVYQNDAMKSCLTGKDAGGAPNAAGFCKNSILPSASIPQRDGFAGTNILEVGVYNAAGDRLDGFFDCKMKRVLAAVPNAANSPDACVRVRCGYMGTCPGSAATCAQHDMGGIVCQMYGLRNDASIAGLSLLASNPIPSAQIISGCTISQNSFDCTTAPGYDPSKTYYITGLDPTTCKPICTVAVASVTNISTSGVWSRDSANDSGCSAGSQSEAYLCVDSAGCNKDTPVVGLPAGPSGGKSSISIPCSSPKCTELSSTGVALPSPGTRTQTFSFSGTVSPGTVFGVMVYSHGVSVTAASGDTITTMVSKLVTAVNNTTLAQWNDKGSDFTNTKPSATATASDAIQLKLNFQNVFGCSAN